jgi:7,8-dihydropterin-6-yl-methyl-4-(beta-D-ribofuranosyl)aminobenzene 5'-phosphate synthase
VLNNLRLLGFRPADLDAVVISHGHYDHTGGLGHILQAAGKPLPVFIHPAAFKARFSLAGGDAAPIGIPTTKERLSAWGAEWRLADGPVEVAGGLWLSGEVPRVAPYWRGGCQAGDEARPRHRRDEIEDDLSLFLVRGRSWS